MACKLYENAIMSIKLHNKIYSASHKYSNLRKTYIISESFFNGLTAGKSRFLF